LARVIGERRHAQLAARPRQVKRMSEKMFGSDLLIDGVEVCVHKIFGI
jgi:hypothetical protein